MLVIALVVLSLICAGLTGWVVVLKKRHIPMLDIVIAIDEFDSLLRYLGTTPLQQLSGNEVQGKYFDYTPVTQTNLRGELTATVRFKHDLMPVLIRNNRLTGFKRVDKNVYTVSVTRGK